MTATIQIDPSWLCHGAALGRILDQVRALERPAPWTPPSSRQPGHDGDHHDSDSDDLAQLLDGIDEPRGPAAPSPLPSPPKPIAAPPAAAPIAGPTRSAVPAPPGPPATGKLLYRWGCDHKSLPEINRIGKDCGFPRLISDWQPTDVATAWQLLHARASKAHADPSRNGRHR